MGNSDDSLLQRLNRETSTIDWRDLQRFYARGVVFAVARGLDLIAVAASMHRDDKPAVQQWLADGSVRRVDDHQAQQWLAREQVVWAVVVAPWILVQETTHDNN